MIVSTLCYIEDDGKYLMLLRNKKQKDVNEGKWIGVGGRMEPGESPEDCICREVLEETGLTITEYRLRGVLTFSSEGWEDEYIFVFTSDKYTGDLKECDEGELRWIDKTEIMNLNLWEGDRIFLKNLLNDDPFFSMRLSYKGDNLTDHVEHFY
ncbi:MAG: 8-oxo-dGTP diphosphatase [Lachnospiraceae bacterium]|nr:8-oxo-dGTP diphosphatase [Lachnospiraceae bacterium]